MKLLLSLISPTGLILSFLVAALSFCAIQQLRISSYQTQIATIQKGHAETLQKISDKAAVAAMNALISQQATVAAIAAKDRALIEQKERLNHENDELRIAVADGTKRLRIRAVCPTTPAISNLPTQSTSAGAFIATTVELDREIGQTVLDLRKDLIDDRDKILGLQAYARELESKESGLCSSDVK